MSGYCGFFRCQSTQSQPPVSLWNSSSFSAWFLSPDLIDRKMYPPMNSCTTLQTAVTHWKSIFSNSNVTRTCFISQLTLHVFNSGKRSVFSVSPVLRSMRSMRLEAIPSSSCKKYNQNHYHTNQPKFISHCIQTSILSKLKKANCDNINK